VKKDKKIATNKRRSFIKKAGLLTLGADLIQLSGVFKPMQARHLEST